MCSFEELKESGSAVELCLNSTLRCMPSFVPEANASDISCHPDPLLEQRRREPTLPPCGGRGHFSLVSYRFFQAAIRLFFFALWFYWTSADAPCSLSVHMHAILFLDFKEPLLLKCTEKPVGDIGVRCYYRCDVTYHTLLRGHKTHNSKAMSCVFLCITGVNSILMPRCFNIHNCSIRML